jgi:hypothetical protein
VGAPHPALPSQTGYLPYYKYQGKSPIINNYVNYLLLIVRTVIIATVRSLPRVMMPGQGATKMQSIQLATLDVAGLRTRLKKMSDEELRKFGRRRGTWSPRQRIWAGHRCRLSCCGFKTLGHSGETFMALERFLRRTHVVRQVLRWNGTNVGIDQPGDDPRRGHHQLKEGHSTWKERPTRFEIE